MINKFLNEIVFSLILIVIVTIGFIIPGAWSAGTVISFVGCCLLTIFEYLFFKSVSKKTYNLSYKLYSYKNIIIFFPLNIFLFIFFCCSKIMGDFIEYYFYILIDLFVCVLFVFYVIETNKAVSNVIEIETKQKDELAFAKHILTELEIIKLKVKDQNLMAALVNIIDKLKFSDPVSIPALKELEDNISKLVSEIKDDRNLNEENLNKLKILIEERNLKSLEEK